MKKAVSLANYCLVRGYRRGRTVESTVWSFRGRKLRSMHHNYLLCYPSALSLFVQSLTAGLGRYGHLAKARVQGRPRKFTVRG